MITLSNISSYEAAARRVAEGVHSHFLTRFRTKDLCRSLWDTDTMYNHQVMGLDFNKNKCIPSGLGPAFDEEYPTFRERLFFFAVLARLCTVDCRPRQDGLDFKAEQRLDGIITHRGPYLEDHDMGYIIGYVHYVHEFLTTSPNYGSKPKTIKGIMSTCPFPIKKTDGLKLLTKDIIDAVNSKIDEYLK